MRARTVPELIAATAAGAPVKYLKFWGHRPPRGGGIGPGCLSQWWAAPFRADGHEFATAEHYMMWRKARLFGAGEVAARILAAGHPKQAKDLGRAVPGFAEDVWDAHRVEIVVAGNAAKFAAHPALRDYLLTTGPRVLVEASPVDRVWGIGLAADDPRSDHPADWQGLNLLGFALMEVRDRLAGPR